jgi:glycosyltransferase involved in cell wall biosynthesis
MTLRPGVSLFIPVFNEAALIQPHTRRLIDYMETLNIPYEIILGSNGSTDSTVSLATRLSAANSHIRLFHLPHRGVGAAFREGIRKARHERIVTVDMDLSIRLDFIPLAYDLLESHDMVVGSKITGTQQRKWIRTVASHAFIWLARLLLKIDFHDYSIAAKGYRRDLALIYGACIDDKTFYVTQIIYYASRDRCRIVEVPVECIDLRGSRFNLVHEGIYKFGHLFWLWMKRDRLKTEA